MVLIGWAWVTWIQKVESVPPELHGPRVVPPGGEVDIGQAEALASPLCSGGGRVLCHMRLELSSPGLGDPSLSCSVSLLGSRI